jgi:hypothetical protein
MVANRVVARRYGEQNPAYEPAHPHPGTGPSEPAQPPRHPVRHVGRDAGYTSSRAPDARVARREDLHHMSNYQEGQGGYAQGGSQVPGSFEGMPSTPQGGGSAYPPQAGQPQQTSQFSAPAGQWSGDQSHHQGPFSGRAGLSLRNSLKTTEFWVFVVVSIALLIASAVSDDDNGVGFDAQAAWKFVTFLAVAYILSRGLAKLGGRNEGSDERRR